MGLKEYKSKRRFGETPEPESGLSREEDHLIFVVHKHAARALHYDLRLEMEGVLKSWAVPKGPSVDPSVKRLAVMVEDHPFDYKDFEGVIPEGNYGAGRVIIWDRGFYRHPAAKDRKENERLLLEGLKKGNLKFVLHGEKLRGEFALVKTRSDVKSWLLLKKADQYAVRDDILSKNRSVASGKMLEEVFDTSEEKPSAGKISQIRLDETLEGDDLKDAPVKPMPHNVRPMLATLVRQPFDDPDWLFEVKWDGFRAIAEIRNKGISLYSRNGTSFMEKFFPVAEALRKLRFEAVLDGEIVVVDDQGLPDFEKLQNYQKAGSGHLLYYVFDLLHFQGHDLTSLPLLRRKELLMKILPPQKIGTHPLLRGEKGDVSLFSRVRVSDHVVKDGKLFFGLVREKGLEGIIAKHSGSLYMAGSRSRQWLKVKTRLTQEAVIAGFTEAGRSRKFFGSLVLGVYEGDELIYIGRSGGGFTTKGLREIREKLDPLTRKKCPFKAEPETNAPVTWVKPQLVCEVAFLAWTDEGVMRQPVFLRLREDKKARDVVIERAEGEKG